ncbi:hypothetical protein [Nocardia otitidiscaviarum]|nr:hypothetical protein [Nocardia otitidiscaviarum]
MTILAECAQAGGPMTWWQALLVVLACFGMGAAVLLVIGRRR